MHQTTWTCACLLYWYDDCERGGAREEVRSPTISTPTRYDDYEEMLAFATVHSVKPMVELFPASLINEAITKVRNNTARYRIVLEMNPVMA
jgi:D-arabinose 1-dehydrogenase-like Zn-dependent alcohol dehydrogenase